MLTLKHIKALNIEISSKCIAACPFCSRNQKIRPYGNHMISFADFKKLPQSLMKGLKWVNFGGNFGDLSTNRDLVKISEYLKTLNKNIFLGGNTNGSVQSEEWWNLLGQFFRDGSMEFSVDGLSDTHAIHRVGTDFQKIIKNIEAFTNAGGVAHWKFILFKHNEHQLDEAEQKARQIGCKRFLVIPSRDYNGELKKAEHFQFDIKRDIFHSYNEKMVSSDALATCKPLDNGSLYIAADGTVYPCCHAHCMYITEHNRLFNFVVPLIDKYSDRINFKRTPLEEILKGPFFNEILEKSQTNSYCGIKCNQFRKTIKKVLGLLEFLKTLSDRELLMAFRPINRIDRDLKLTEEEFRPLYPEKYIKNGNFYLVDYIEDNMTEDWDMKAVSNYKGEVSKDKFLFHFVRRQN